MDSVSTNKSFIDQKIEEAQHQVTILDQKLQPFYTLLKEKEQVEHFIEVMSSLGKKEQPRTSTRANAKISKQLDENFIKDPRFDRPFTRLELRRAYSLDTTTSKTMIRRLLRNDLIVDIGPAPKPRREGAGQPPKLYQKVPSVPVFQQQRDI